jgi:hypothetical protein
MFVIRLDNQPVWFEDGKEMTYATEQDAELALIEEMAECEHACKLGYMEDEGDFSNYRIIKAK